MANSKKEWKHPAVFREIKSSIVKNLLEIEGKVLQDAYSFTPLAFLTVFENFQRQDANMKMTIQFSVFELLALKHALQEAIVSWSAPEYRNYSGGNENGKWLTINVLENSVGLSFQRKGKQIGMMFTRWEAKALCDTLDEVASALIAKRDEIAWSRYMKDLQKGVRS